MSNWIPVAGPPLMTAREVAAVYRVSQLTVTRWGAAGKLYRIRLPYGGYRYLRAEVAAFLNGQPLTAEQVQGGAGTEP